MDYPHTIMIIDEDSEDTEIFCDVIHEIDDTIQCIRIKDGVKALKNLLSDAVKPEFIFVDLNMTLINGKDWLTEIKKMEDLKDIPVIIYSGSKSSLDINDARKLGAAFYLIKPLRMSELKNSLTTVFEHRQEEFLA
jgi:DNA-binding NtrC family response regulator